MRTLPSTAHLAAEALRHREESSSLGLCDPAAFLSGVPNYITRRKARGERIPPRTRRSPQSQVHRTKLPWRGTQQHLRQGRRPASRASFLEANETTQRIRL